MKKKVWLPILGLLVLLAMAAGAYTFLYLPVERTFQAAMAASRQAPYAEARQALTAAREELSQKPFAKKQVEALSARLEELFEAEVDRALAADELLYAADLLQDGDPDRAAQLRDTVTYRENRAAYEAADALEQAGREEEAQAAFLALKDFEDAADRAAAIQTRMDFRAADAVFTGTNFDEAIAAFLALGTEEGQAAADALSEQKDVWMATRRQQFFAAAQGRISAGAWHTAALSNAPWIAGDARFAAPPAQADGVFSGPASVFFLSQGRVLPAGETFGAEEQIAALTDVKKVAPGLVHGLFLLGDGRVVALGSKALDRLPQEEWTGMTDVAAGAWHSLALTGRGTVVACGTNDHGQCDVDGWNNITALSAGLWHSVGLQADGTVVACGDNTYGQCNVKDWTNIVFVSCGACTTVGLKADGTVVACGDNAAGQCMVSGWTDIAAIAAGAYHTVGLRLDGTLIAAGLAPKELPSAPLFASDWACAAVPATQAAAPVATAYVQGTDSDLGPWLYMDPKGIALICIDYSENRELFRADMLATHAALPGGRVTNPEAKGNYIIMPSVLPEEQARNNHAVLAFTGDYIGFTSNRKGVMIRNGITYYDRTETTTLAILPDGTLAFYRNRETDAAALQALGVRDSFSFGPLLVQDKQRAYVSQGKDEITMRVAFGYTDPYHYLAAITLRDRKVQMSFPMIADVCVRYGCRVAYNLDGGHSTSLTFMGRELSMLTLRNTPHTNIRGLSDIILFLESDAVGEN